MPAKSEAARGVRQSNFLAHQIEPNGVYLHMMLARDGDKLGKRGIELHIPHPVVRYILAAQSISRLGF